MGEGVTAVTDANFKSEVLDSDVPVLVDFWAAWCGPCRMIAPVVESLAQEMGGKVKVVKMDIDQNPMTPQSLGIMSIPTVIVFKGGRAADRSVGYSPSIKADLRQKLETALA